MTEYGDYFLRVRQSDVPQLHALAVLLGVLAQREDGSYGIAPGRLGAWEVVGEITRPTGELLDVDGVQTPVMAPVLDEAGDPYWHANLRIDVDLMELAQASTHPQVLAGLADIGRWFVTGEDGRAKAPSEPARVWL